MYYDPTGGVKFAKDNSWLNVWKDIEKDGQRIFSSSDATRRKINELVRGLDDEYSMYFTPEMLHRDFFPQYDRSESGPAASIGIHLAPMKYCRKDSNGLLQAILKTLSPQMANAGTINRKACAVVAGVLPESPAERAGN